MPGLSAAAMLAVGASLLAGGGAAARVLGRAGAARWLARAGYLDRCLPLFDSPRQALAPDGLPRLSGCRDGALWDVQLVPDALTFRKLPALWLLVARIAPRPAACQMTILRRPTGHEPFSGFSTLPVNVVPAPELPEDCAIRAPAPVSAPPPAGLLAEALDDPRVKELRLAASGLRLVWLAEEGERGRYLLFREIDLARRPLAPEVLLRVMARLESLAAGLAPAATEARAA